MSIVNITIANKKYEIGCENGQEQRLVDLGAMLASRANEILDEMGPMPDPQMLFTLCIVLADELNTSGDADMLEILERVREIKRKLS